MYTASLNIDDFTLSHNIVTCDGAAHPEATGAAPQRCSSKRHALCRWNGFSSDEGRELQILNNSLYKFKISLHERRWRTCPTLKIPLELKRPKNIHSYIYFCNEYTTGNHENNFNIDSENLKCHLFFCVKLMSDSTIFSNLNVDVFQV